MATIADKVIAENPKTVAEVRQGNLPALKFLIGQALRKAASERKKRTTATGKT